MAQAKNSFLRSKMNKDLDDRLIPNGEYRDAVNITVNKSDGQDVGTAQTIRGNSEVIDFNITTGQSGLQVVGLLKDDSLNTIFAFVTNNTGEAYDPSSYSAIISWQVESASSSAKIIVEGNWLNFSTLYPITGINLLEELLFFTDNRNQPRKVNINNPEGYYTTEDQISVAKYYPYESIILYQPSEDPNTIIATTTTTAASTNNVMLLSSTIGVAVGQGVLLDSGSSTEILYNTFVTAVDTARATVASDATASTTIILENTVLGDITPGASVSDTDGVITPGTTVISYTPGTNTLVLSAPQTVQAGLVLTFTNSGTSVFTNQNVNVDSGATINFVAAETTMQDAISEYMPSSGEGLVSNISSSTQFTLDDYTGYQNPVGDTIVGGVEPSVYIESLAGDWVDTGAKATSFTLDLLNGGYIITTDIASGVALSDRVLIAFENPYYDQEFAETANIDYLEDKFVRFSYRYKFDDGEYSLIAPFTQPCFIPKQDGYFLNKSVGYGTQRTTAQTASTSTTGSIVILLQNVNGPISVGDLVEGSNGEITDGTTVVSYVADPAPLTTGTLTVSSPQIFNNGDVLIFTTQDNLEDTDDFKKAYQSTEVAFMENKVNKILLNIPLPYSQGSLSSNLKITDIEILYKESNRLAIKVVDSLPLSSNFSGNDYYFQYEYGSKSPYKSLPEKENTRVYDKVPVKALSQEIISNRVVYGNYQDKHTPPNFIDYNLAVTPKFSFGPDANDLGSSTIEYPNATVKQNRNYEVGIVLSDRFGRQSTVILSESTLNNLPSYLASTIYSPYRDEAQQSGSTTFDGDSLKVIFNNFIPSSYVGSPGLYNGDQSSEDYNPLGWYSYKVVVKQLEQDYYNAYVAPIMKGYPTNNNKERFDTSHISLFGDNINKIPRDLSELGPTQKQFRSSVKLWPRVACDTNSSAPFYKSSQFFPERVGDIASAIGTIDDLFDLPNLPNRFLGSAEAKDVPTPSQYPGYNVNFECKEENQAVWAAISVGDEARGIPFGSYDPSDPCTILKIQYNGVYPVPIGTIFTIEFSKAITGSVANNNIGFYRSGEKNYFYNQESDPLVARISTTKQAGVNIPEEYPDSGGALNIYEVEAQESLLDIYWETSTSGLISELNQAISEGEGALVYDRTQGWAPAITEDSNPSGPSIVSSFRAVLLNGTQIDPPALATATIVSVYEQGSPSNTLNLLGNPYIDSFIITTIGNGYFNLDLNPAVDPSELVHTTGNNSLTFEILYEHPNADASFTDFLDINIVNVDPIINNCPVDQIITSKQYYIWDFYGDNGSDTNALNQVDLVWSLDNTVTDITKFTINQSGELRAINLQTPAGTYPIRVVLTDGGGAQDICDFNVTYDYAPTITWNPNGNQIININNTTYPSGGNIGPIMQSGTVTIANGSYKIKLRCEHQGTNTTPWTTSTSANVGATPFPAIGIPFQAPVVSVETPETTFGPGTYIFDITAEVNGLPTGATAQSLCSLIATVVP